MTSLDEAWGRQSSAASPPSGRLVGNNYYSGQNRNMDPSLMPYVGNGMSSGPGQVAQPPPPQQQQQQMMSEWQPPSISVKVEKSEEERELFRYMRSRLGEMDWDRMQSYFRQKCKRKVRKASGECGCLGVSDHLQQCGSCKSMCHQKHEFRANLTLYLLIGVFILLALNLIFPKGFGSK